MIGRATRLWWRTAHTTRRTRRRLLAVARRRVGTAAACPRTRTCPRISRPDRPHRTLHGCRPGAVARRTARAARGSTSSRGARGRPSGGPHEPANRRDRDRGGRDDAAPACARRHRLVLLARRAHARPASPTTPPAGGNGSRYNRGVGDGTRADDRTRPGRHPPCAPDISGGIEPVPATAVRHRA